MNYSVIAGAGSKHNVAAGSVPQGYLQRSTQIHLLPVQQVVCRGAPWCVVSGWRHSSKRRTGSGVWSAKLRHVYHSQ